VLFSCLFACKTSDDAIAGAQQMTTTAADLSRYYNSLADSLSDTIALNELDASFSKVPFDDHSRQLIQDTLSEISKRKEVGQALARLAESMSALSTPTLSSGVASAASALGDELVHVRALPSGPPIPDVIGKASNLLLLFVQQRKEKEAARTMDQTLGALSSLFEKEKPTYDSIFRVHMFLATQLAKDLINRQAVDLSPMLSPAFRPFNLTALPEDGQTRDTLRALALSRLESSADEAKQREMKASSAMLAALQEMSARVHLLATEKPMRTRGNPFSLNIVESWVASATH
jgi:hypothetical protein